MLASYLETGMESKENLAVKHFETESLFKKGLIFKSAKRRNVLRLLHVRLQIHHASIAVY